MCCSHNRGAARTPACSFQPQMGMQGGKKTQQEEQGAAATVSSPQVRTPILSKNQRSGERKGKRGEGRRLAERTGATQRAPPRNVQGILQFKTRLPCRVRASHRHSGRTDEFKVKRAEGSDSAMKEGARSSPLVAWVGRGESRGPPRARASEATVMVAANRMGNWPRVPNN